MLKFFVAQVAISAVVLGALRHKGALQLKPEAIRNEYTRWFVTSMVDYGELAWVKSCELVDKARSDR